MEKIRVTEGELKQIIKESVENIINEAYADRMARRNDKYLTARNNYNNYAKEWGDLTPDQQAAYNQQASAGQTGEFIYNTARNNAARELRRTTRRNGQQFKQELDNTKNEYAKSRDEVDKLSYNNQLLQQQNTQLQNQVNTLTAEIGKWKGQVTNLQRTINTLKAQNTQQTTATQQQQTAAANQQTPQEQKPQTMMAESEDEGIGDTMKTAAQKVKNTMGKTKQTAKNALKNWQGKRDAHDKMIAQQNQARTALANNQINRF